MTMPSAGGNDNAATRNADFAGRDHLPELAAGMLRDVADRARLGRAVSDGSRATMQAVCQNARRCGLRAEQLLVVLKDAWRRLPEARQLDRYESDELLARVIQDCIEVYYAEPPQQAAGFGRDGR